VRRGCWCHTISTEMERGPLLIEGKTKQVYEVRDRPNEVYVVNKDQITANNATSCHQMAGKAKCSNVTNAVIFEYLKDAGVETSFISQVDDNTYSARNCRMIPIEWVTRRIATGSFLKRNPGVKEGYRFTPPKLETFFKDDAAGDPQWSRESILSTKFEGFDTELTEQEYELMAKTTVLVFEVLERAWASVNCTLVDMKIEFGVDKETGHILLSDVIDNDSWRLWEGGNKHLMKDKQVYRNLHSYTTEDMKKVKQGYDWVMEKCQEFEKAPKSLVVILMGSASDLPLADKIQKHLFELRLAVEKRVMSAHKVTEDTLKTVEQYNSYQYPVAIIAIAGRSNGLGPVVSANTPLPVINCPPFDKKEHTHDIWSSLSVPSGLGCSTVLYPEAAALNAASALALSNHRLRARLMVARLKRQLQLAEADAKVRNSSEQ